MLTTTRRLGVAVVAALVLTGCGSSDGDTPATPSPSTPADALAQAKKTLDSTSGVVLDLKASGVPAEATALLSGHGSLTHAPAFDGTIVVQYAGLKPSVPIIATDGKVYAQVPLTTGWQIIDPAEYGAPDPAALMATSGGLSDWFTATTDLTQGDKIRGGQGNKEILTTYTGTLPAASGALLVPLITEDLDVTYALSEQGEVRQIVLSGDIYDTGATEKYTVTLDSYGLSKTITAPK